MPAQWTAELVGKMHLYGITAKQLAAEAGWHDKYLSSVMNVKHSKTARSCTKFRIKPSFFDFLVWAGMGYFQPPGSQKVVRNRVASCLRWQNAT